MKDPVTTPDGNTYEREAIEKWLETHNTEPQTRNILTITQLIPNRALREMYESIYKLETTYDNNTDLPVNLQLEITANEIVENEYNILFTISSPETFIEPYHDIVLCIDTSGSMGSSADKPGNEQTGLSILDILKYSATVIIKSGNEKQRIGIVQFSNEGRIIKPLTVLNEAGKRELMVAIELLSHGGQTNLYDGIIKSWDLFETSTCKNKSIILFTDGEPNIEPPRGYIHQLQNIKEKKYNGKYISDINIYTYGNNVNSELSDKISKETNGVYGFIPDSILMGDLLTHKIAALRSTKTKNAVIKIEFGDNTIVSNKSYDFISTNLLSINVGDVLDGCNRNFILTVKTIDTSIPDIYASLEYENIKVIETVLTLTDNLIDINYNILRQEAVMVLSEFLSQTNSNKDLLFDNFVSKLISDDFRIINLMETFNDQVKLAYSYEYYSKWGKHYLLSLRRALQLEQCNNYKDKCVQHFGGKMFNTILDEVDDIFTSLPPPKPSRIVQQTTRNNQPVPVINMNNFVSRDNACFHGLSKVLMYDYTIKNVSDIKKGDSVKLSNGTRGIIECVVKTILTDQIELITLNENLHITSYHPVKIENQWYFPKDVSYGNPCKISCNEIFSFVLSKDKSHGMIIGDHECATLGHGISGNIIGHLFFGTEKVIDNLKESQSYQSGIVILKQNSVIRNSITDLVEKIVI